MTASGDEDLRWLDTAVRIARQHLGTLGGHPAVAALILDEESGEVFARAVTGPGGSPTAVIAAIAEAGMNAHDRVLVTTLEPSPDDAQMIVASGLSRAVIGTSAPGAEYRKAVALMTEHGLATTVADHQPSARLHAAHAHRVAKQRPLTTLRLAVSRDGMIGNKDGTPIDLLSPRSRHWVGMQRALSDAVLVGARTAHLDDPPLVPGLRGMDGRPYARIVVVGSTPLPNSLRLVAGNHPTWIICEPGKDFGLPPPVEFITVEGRNGRPDLRKAMAALAARNVSSLLVEGGAKLTEAMISAELVDVFQLIKTPSELGRAGLPATALGGIEGRLRAAGFVEIASQPLGPDVLHSYERQL